MSKRDSDNPATDPSNDDAQPGVQAETAEADGTGETAQQLRGELNEANERALRAQAELENFRKRSRREQEDERRFANAGLMRDLLPVLDNVDRAVEAAKKTSDGASLVEGFEMVGQMMSDVLAKHHCQRIEALHETFDPHFHEAISRQPTDEHPPNTVVMVVQNGFRLHDRVIRPSQVIVSCATSAEEGTSAS